MLAAATAGALGGFAARPAEASGQGLCLILLGCNGAPAVPATPPPPAPDLCPAPAGRGNAGFVGMVSEDVFWDASAYRSCTLNDQVASGVGLIRQTFDWAQIERSHGSYDFSWYDALMESLARRRLAVLPILFNAPHFRSSQPRGQRRGARLPRSTGDMARFAARVVRRYGARGTFWRAHPGLPRVPVRAWQVWNEPNLRVYWPTGPSARAYTRLLKATAAAIRDVDRRAEVVTAGIADSDHGVPFRRYVEGMYRAGAAPAFDTLGVNVYAPSASGVLSFVRRARRIMRRHGDRRGGIRLTEFGWATGGPRSRFRVSQSAQASHVSTVLRSLHRNRRNLRLRGVVYYNWRDGRPYPPLFQDFFGLHTGLLEASGRPKSAYFAFRRVVPRLR